MSLSIRAKLISGLLLAIFFLAAIPAIAQDEQGVLVWQRVEAVGPVNDVYFINPDTGWVVGDEGIIKRTYDGGETWLELNSNTTSSLNSVYFTDSKNGWVVSDNGAGILRTENGGTTWIAVGSISTSLYSVFFIDSETGWVVGSNGTILHTTDGGQNWEAQTSGTTEDLYSIYFVDENTGWAVGGNDTGTILHTVNGGLTWMPQSNEAASLKSVYFLDSETGWTVGGGVIGEILHTNNGGQTWTRQETEAERPLTSVYFVNPDTGWVVGAGGTIQYTQNAGQTWTMKWAYSHVTYSAIHFVNEEAGWIAGGARLFRRTEVPYLPDPALISPDDKDRVDSPVTLRWSPIDGLYVLDMQVSTDSTFTSTFVLDQFFGSHEGTQYQLTNLSGNETYYWQVRRRSTETPGLISKWVRREFHVNPTYMKLHPDSAFIFLPNYVNVMFHVTDENGKGIVGLDETDFEVYEDDKKRDNISTSEAGFQVEPLDQISVTTKIIMLMDNSESLEGNLDDVKEAAKSFIRNKTANQEIAIYTFSDKAREIVSFTRDTTDLLQAIDGIDLGFSNTNLYGSIVEMLGKWEDSFSLSHISRGHLVVFSDGNHESGTATLEDVIAARGDKQVFAVGFGDVTPSILEQIGNAGAFYEQNDISRLSTLFAEVQNDLIRLSNSYYWFNFSSPTLGDAEHKLTIRLTSKELVSEIYVFYNSKFFYATKSEILVNASAENLEGVDSITMTANASESVQIHFPFNYSVNPLTFEISDPSKLSITPHPDSLFIYTFKGSGIGAEKIEVIITDTVSTDVEPKTLTVNFEPAEVNPPENVIVEAERTFGDATDAQDYRLIALPGAIDQSLSDVLPGEAGATWQAFWDNGAEQDYLIEYDGSSQFNLAPGNGFWVTSTDTIRFDQTIASVTLNAQNQAVIPLHPGWNIISNPLDIHVSWSNVAAANGGSLQPVWSFEGTFDEATVFESAKTGQAFYFLNDQELEQLAIPYIEALAKGKMRSEDIRHELQLITLADDQQTSISRIIFVDQKDKNQVDVIAPPGAFEGASLRFTAEGAKSKRVNTLARLYRRLDVQGQSFAMQLKATPHQPIIIKLKGWNRSLGAKVVLIDQATGRSYDLSSSEGIGFKPEKELTQFLFVMGSSEYLKRKQGKYLPKQVQVMPNYPNPFNPTTTISFALPTESKVHLQVFDVIGRSVAVLIDGVRPAGVHHVRFDASRYASGMYFAVFDIGKQRFIQKMLLIK